MSDTITLPAVAEPKEEEKTKRQPPYNVILLNDDDHTFEYVITMLQVLFGYPREQGQMMADEVHRTGRCILLTTTKEHAELKQDQIHAFGPDPLSSKDCQGSMTAVIEPAEG
jgi:ATP-dependent Clp protease adaptor protein ClpS